jgi:large subunit ribosomal protein L5
MSEEKEKKQKGQKGEGGHKEKEGGHKEGAHKEGSPKGEGHGKGPRPEGGGKKDRKPKGQPAPAEAEETGPVEPAPPPRLLIHFREKVVPELKQKFNYTNALAVPRLEKIVLSMGVGKLASAGEKAKIEQAEKELGVIAGQKPVRCKAKKSVANFKIREGQETGLKVTLRGGRMYEFLDRLISLAIPRVRDFRGLSPDGFDKEGNYNFGFNEQTVFPEVNSSEVTFQQGMNITMVTSAPNPEQGRELLKQFGFPFRTDEKEENQEKTEKAK